MNEWANVKWKSSQCECVVGCVGVKCINAFAYDRVHKIATGVSILLHQLVWVFN